MPPVTPRRTRRPSKGRMPPPGGSLLRAAAARDDAVLDVAAGELLERAGGELLVALLRAAERGLVEQARVLRGDEHAEVLVRRVLRGDLGRSEDAHGLSGSM